MSDNMPLYSATDNTSFTYGRIEQGDVITIKTPSIAYEVKLPIHVYTA